MHLSWSLLAQLASMPQACSIRKQLLNLTLEGWLLEAY
jgi:hypothetical protein